MGIGSSTVAPDVPDRNGNKTKQQQQQEHNQHKTAWCSCFDRKQSVEFGEVRVTKEEAREWLGNFDSLMASEVGRKVFQEFLQSQYSDENMKFWLAAERYRDQPVDVRKTLGRTVYEDYISTISPCEVSIDAKLRAEIEENLDEGDSDLFLTAQEYIYSLMYRDCFPRFLRSKYYKSLCT